MRHRLMLIPVIILCAIVSHAIGISNVVALDNRVRSDLKLDDNDIWEFKADSNRIESILVGLRSITNGMHKMTVTTLMGEPDRKVRAPDKSVASMHGTSQYDYNLKKKKLNGANVNDWMLSIMFTKDETLNYILYQRDGQVEKIDITN